MTDVGGLLYTNQCWSISLGFQLVNPLRFDIKNYVSQGQRDNHFDEWAIREPLEHLAKFYEIFSMWKPIYVNDDQVKLHLFGFSLIGRAKEWLQCLPNRTIQTWK